MNVPYTENTILLLMYSECNLSLIILRYFRQLEIELTGVIPVQCLTMDEFISAHYTAVQEFVRVCSNGALKYDRDNWRNGFPKYTLMDSALRHYFKYITPGSNFDVVDEKTLQRKDILEHFNGDVELFKSEFATHHLAHLIWNLMVMVELDDI